MGWLDGGGGSSKSYTYGRGASPARSTRSASGGFYSRPSHNRSSSSFFGNNNNARASSSFFGSSRGGSSSYYKRSPRQGYIGYLFHKLQRMLRELWYYARRHPMKAFFAVVVPLLSAGGAIGGLLKGFGIRMPMEGLGGGSRRGGGGYYGSEGYGGERGGGLMDNLGPIMQIAKAFT